MVPPLTLCLREVYQTCPILLSPTTLGTPCAARRSSSRLEGHHTTFLESSQQFVSGHFLVMRATSSLSVQVSCRLSSQRRSSRGTRAVRSSNLSVRGQFVSMFNRIPATRGNWSAMSSDYWKLYSLVPQDRTSLHTWPTALASQYSIR